MFLIQLTGMPFMIKENKTFNPGKIGKFCFMAQVFLSAGLSNRFQQYRPGILNPSFYTLDFSILLLHVA
jgi:hypothetical protein